MITLRKGNHYCTLSINEDLFGGWLVKQISWCQTWSGMRNYTYEFNDEALAIEKLFDLECAKRKLRYSYVD